MRWRAYVDHYAYEGTFAYDYMDPLNPGLTVNRDTPWANWSGVELPSQPHVLGKTPCDRWDRRPLRLWICTSRISTWRRRHLHRPDRHGLQPGCSTRRTSFVCITICCSTPACATIITNVWQHGEPARGSDLPAVDARAYSRCSTARLSARPNAYEFDYESADYKGNHGLSPETIRSYELVWEQDLGRHWRFTSSLFYNQIEDSDHPRRGSARWPPGLPATPIP